MGRSPRRSSQVVEGLNRGAWTSVEDKTLIDYVKSHGEGKWSNVSKVTGLRRCGKSCRLRWMNYLRPDIKRGNISIDEEELILRLHKLLGNRWALIAGRLPGRTDNEVKNYWNTHLAKKAQDQTPSISSPQAPQNMDKFTNMMPLITRFPSNTPPPPASAAGGGNGDPHLVPPQSQVLEPHRNNNYDQSSMLSSLNVKDLNLSPNGMINNASQPGSNDRSSPLTCGNAEDSGQDFVIDFNIDDIYQILDPGFVRLDGVDLSDLSISVENPHHPLDDREPAKHEIGPNTDLRSLASFLESEEWLGDEDHVIVTCKDDQVGR